MSKMSKRKRLINSILLGAVSAAVTFGGLGISSYADETESDVKLDLGLGTELDAEFTVENVDFNSEASRNELLSEANSFPSSFDLRNVDTDGDGVGECYVTPVKLQNPFPTCWGFAAAAAAEISILGSLLADDPEAYKTLDLSEKQLAYFSNKYLEDENDRQNGEGTYLNFPESSASYYTGGLPFLAASIFAQGIGPVNESRDEIFKYKGKNGYTIQRVVDGVYEDISYSDEDDWYLTESERFQQDYILSESTLLPSPAGYDDNDRYYFNEAGVAAIKEELMNIRGVEIGFCADQSKPNEETGDGKYLQTKNWAHYTYEQVNANHAVTIIGWDDDYPKENFISEHQPPANGAFLVKNSWGSGEEEFPNKGYGDWGIQVPKTDESGNVVTDGNGDPVMVGSGYFWLSYYDKTLTFPETFVFDENKGTESYYLDEHNMMPVAEPDASVSKKEVKAANIFYPDGCEILHAVSYETRNPNTTVTCEVYLLADEAGTMDDAILMERNVATYRYGGFHKIDLENPVLIQKRQPYCIVITQQQEDGTYAVPLSIGIGNSTYAKTYAKSVINEQESMLYADGEWYDYASKDVQYALVPEEEVVENNYVFDNFPIKGYCTIAENDINMRIKGGNPWGKMVLSDGYDVDSYNLMFTGDKGYEVKTEDIEWSLAEGGESIVDLAVSDDRSEVALKAKKVGSTFLIANVNNVGTRAIRIFVGNMQIGAVSLLDDSFISTYTGKQIRPRVEVIGEDQKTVFEEGKQYTLSYGDNLKCGVGLVSVISIEDPDEPDPLRPMDMNFVIKPAKTEITNVTSDGTSAVITVKDESDWGISGYKAAYREKGTEEWTIKTFAPDSPSLKISGLAAEKEYEFKACGYIDIPEEQQIGGIEPSYDGDYSDIATASKQGWKYEDGGYRYYGADGNCYTGWHYMGSAEGETTPHWSYFEKNGFLATGWRFFTSADGENIPHYSYFGANGWLRTGWQQMGKGTGNAFNENSNTHWSYFGGDGWLRTGWQQMGKGTANTYGENGDTHWSYFGGNGWLRTGWIELGKGTSEPDGNKAKHWSYFGGDGWLRTGLQQMGAGTRNTFGENTALHLSYFGNDGWLAVNKRITVSGKNYTADSRGWLK